MRSQLSQAPRSLWVLLSLSLVLAVAVPTVTHHRKVRDRESVERVAAIAAGITVPSPMTPLVLHHDCNGEGLVFCGWTAEHTVASLVDPVRTDLARVSDRPVRTECYDDVPTSARTGLEKACLIQVMDGSHAITIFLDPYVQPKDKGLRVTGARYTVQAG